MDLRALEISKKHLDNVSKNLDYNRSIGAFYEQLIQDAATPTERNRFEKKQERLQDCNSLWDLDVYHEAKIKDFKRTNLCKDKFCNNCKKVKQASRMAKFMPEIERVGKKYKLSQMVLTVPNVPGEELRETIKLIFKAFTSVTHYLSKKTKIKGLNFDIGYVGAIRSLEVTYKNNEYHPHLHVLLAHSEDIGPKEHVNKFSYDKFGKRETRYFSEYELLIQKLWYLLFNDYRDLKKESREKRKRITKDRIQDLESGFSIMIDEFHEDDFIELFKYMTKGDGTDHKENSPSSIMTYENFKTLYFALDSVRQIQGYGEFFRIKDDEELYEEVHELYASFIEKYQKKEVPEQVRESVHELKKDMYYTLITKNKLYSYVKKLDN